MDELTYELSIMKLQINNLRIEHMQSESYEWEGRNKIIFTKAIIEFQTWNDSYFTFALPIWKQASMSPVESSATYWKFSHHLNELLILNAIICFSRFF